MDTIAEEPKELEDPKTVEQSKIEEESKMEAAPIDLQATQDLNPDENPTTDDNPTADENPACETFGPINEKEENEELKAMLKELDITESNIAATEPDANDNES